MPEPRAADVAAHAHAAWRDRADVIVQVDLAQHGMPGKWEQLWARRLGEHEFELCSIPFFAYGMTLGDVVETLPGSLHVGAVVQKSGRHLLRAAFTREAPPDLHERLHGPLVMLGVPHEWHASGYLACSPANDAEVTPVRRLLERFEARGYLQTELDP